MPKTATDEAIVELHTAAAYINRALSRLNSPEDFISALKEVEECRKQLDFAETSIRRAITGV
jgi:hypothetical protein